MFDRILDRTLDRIYYLKFIKKFYNRIHSIPLVKHEKKMFMVEYNNTTIYPDFKSFIRILKLSDVEPVDDHSFTP